MTGQDAKAMLQAAAWFLAAFLVLGALSFLGAATPTPVPVATLADVVEGGGEMIGREAHGKVKVVQEWDAETYLVAFPVGTKSEVLFVLEPVQDRHLIVGTWVRVRVTVGGIVEYQEASGHTARVMDLILENFEK